MGRQLCSHLSLLHPDFTIQDRVLNKQQSQKDHHDSRANRQHFTIGDTVFVRDFPTGNKWLPGTVTQRKGPLSFLIKLADGRVFRHHIDHIRERPPSANIPISTHPIGQMTLFHIILILQSILLLYLTVDYGDHPAQENHQIVFIKLSDLN